MILDIAASLLNENYTISEAADTVARQGVTRWLKNEYPYIKYGTNPDDPVLDADGHPITDDNGNAVRTNIEDIFNEANMVFGHPINLGAPHRYKFIEKYLPGAVRIAFTECGWKSNNEDKAMMAKLKAIYAALFFNWWDGCEYTWVREGRSRTNGHWEARNPGYKGLIDGPSEVAIADFNGMSFSELYNKFKDLIPEVKARLAAQAQHATAEEREEEERPSAPVVRNNTPYHIEYIATHAEAKRWEPYTNHRTTHAGCHWCITDRDISNWNHYNCGRSRFVYFCWKAPSLEALKEMNIMDDRPGHYYSFCAGNASERELRNAPMNEYGLSLICIMVENDGNGEPRFHQATSRYNHTNPAGEDMCGGMYGDNLVPQDSDEGYRKILRILEMDDAEFKRTFKIPNAGPVSHNNIVDKIKRYREQKKVKQLFAELNAESMFDNGAVINDQGYYNFLRSDGTLASDTWFKVMSAISVSGIEADTFIVKNDAGLYNILKANGKYLLERDVQNIYCSNDDPTKNKYAKIQVKPHLFNIVNLDTGLIMLKKPVFEVFLQQNYTKGIVVRKAQDDPLTILNINGREIYKYSDPNDIPIVAAKDVVMIRGNTDDDGYVTYKLSNITNGKLLWKKKLKESEDVVCAGYSKSISFKSDHYSALLSCTGRVLFDTTGRTQFGEIAYRTPESNKYNYIYVRHNNVNYVVNVNTGEKFEFNSNFNVAAVSADKIIVTNGDKVQQVAMDTGNVVNTYENVTSIDGEFMIVKEGRGSYKIYNYMTDSIVLETSSSPEIMTTRRSRNGSLQFVVIQDNTKIYILDGNNEQFNKVELKRSEVNEVFYLGFNCFGITFNDGKANIINQDGKWLFKHKFSEMLNRYFGDDGIMSIKAGDKDYFINIEGDVSRTVEALAESFNTAAENAGILVENEEELEESVIAESTDEQQDEVQEKTPSLVDISTYFMD